MCANRLPAYDLRYAELIFRHGCKSFSQNLKCLFLLSSMYPCVIYLSSMSLKLFCQCRGKVSVHIILGRFWRVRLTMFSSLTQNRAKIQSESPEDLEPYEVRPVSVYRVVSYQMWSISGLDGGEPTMFEDSRNRKNRARYYVKKCRSDGEVSREVVSVRGLLRRLIFKY